MQKFYKYFDYFLNLSLVSSFVAIVLYLYLSLNNYTFPGNSLGLKGSIIEFLIIIVFFSGLLYMLLGFSIFIVNWKKNIQRAKFGRRLLLKGLLKSVLSFLLIFFLSLVLSFFGLSTSNCLCLPKIQDPGTPGFPVSDLKIVKRKAIPPKISDYGWECDLTIKNNNPTKTTVELTFNHAEDDGMFDDTIPPGQTRVINVSYTDTVTSQDLCHNVSITSSEILNANSDN